MVILILKGAGLACYLCLGLWLLIKLLRDKYANSIQVVWYLFALAFHATLLVLWWASATHAIDSNGNENGEVGAYLMKSINTALDLKLDMYVMGALASLVVIPQIGSYTVSSLYGCASRPRFVAMTAEWLSWGAAKSFAITSAIFTAITIWGAANGWKGFNANEAIGYLNLSAMLILLSFAILLIKYHLEEFPELAKQYSSSAIGSRAIRLHRWATRHRRDLNRVPVIDKSQPASASPKGVPQIE